MKKRIGFLLASIHTGSALDVWTTLASEARRSGGAFFVFPGGRLDSHPDSEYLRNCVYRLANAENVDGLISWGSSIGGAVSIEELDHFHERLEPVPYVTIAHKMNGHPCVGFDAYTGFKSLVRHFIDVHGARKIAFLRGPATHASAGDRYRAFCDACAEAGIAACDEGPLVSSPWPWSAGESAIAELYEGRKLVPGRDFTALIAASDMMAFSAVRYLGKAGYRVPSDYLVGGFNDSAESRILESAFSTVHLPYNELAIEAYRLIRKMLGSKGDAASARSVACGGSAADEGDRILSAEMVIRESCGCDASVAAAGPVNFGPGGLIGELARVFRLDDTGVNASLEPIVEAARSRDDDAFLGLCERALVRFFEDGMDEGLLSRALSVARSSRALDQSWLDGIETRLYRLMYRVQGRVQSFTRYETSKRYATLNALKCELLGARDRDSLASILSAYLPDIGMHTCAVVLWENDGTSRFVGGFSPAGIESDSAGTVFPDRRLLPERVERLCSEGVFMVQPLFMENRPLGYFVSNVPFRDGPMLEDIRSAISSSLKGIFLFEEANRAKQAAERAERAQTEFFANAGNELVEPLREIGADLAKLADLSSPETRLEGDAPARDDAPSLVRAIGEKLESQLERTERLIDLTLSGFDGLTFDNRLSALRELFDREAGGVDMASIDRAARPGGKGKILFVGEASDRFEGWAGAGDFAAIPSMSGFRAAVAECAPSLVVFFDIDVDAVSAVRHDRSTVLVPVFVLPDRIEQMDDVASLGVIPRVVLANRSIASDPEFAARARAILAGDEILPPHTGALVKNAIQYLNVHASSQISRWKLADTVNVSEDYLTRIFRRETGVSMWEYLARYRVFLATELLLHTNRTINEIALATGFQDQAYFCRVFKKITGVPPGKMRNR